MFVFHKVQVFIQYIREPVSYNFKISPQNLTEFFSQFRKKKQVFYAVQKINGLRHTR
jgi:hypothetical protein